MSLVDRLADRLKNSEPLVLEVISRRCLRTRFHGSSCDRCAQECPVEAIRLEVGKIILDPKRCVGCLACTAVCPAEALIGCDSRLAAAAAKVAAGKAVSLCCEKTIRTGDEIVLPCLGALSDEHLMAFAVRSKVGVHLYLAGCSDCRASSVPLILTHRLQALNHKVGDNGLTAIIRLITNKEEAEAGHPTGASSRRSFFRAFWDISVHSATETMTTLQAESNPREKPTHKHQPGRLTLLRQALAETGEENARLALLSLFYSLAVGNDCNFCGACAGMCPTGALKNSREEMRKQLQFDWARCSGCGLCQQFCRKKALTLSAGRLPNACAVEKEIIRQVNSVLTG